MMPLRAAWIVALFAAAAPAAAQHEHHAAPASVLLTGMLGCTEDVPLRGAIVQLFQGARLMATSVTDATGRFALRAGGGTFTLEFTYPGLAPHRQPVTVAAAPVDVGAMLLSSCPVKLDPLAAHAERAVVEWRSGVVAVDARASPAAGGSIADLLRTVPGIELTADGRITMRGSSSVLMLMDGRRIPLAGDALAAFLRQMPAASLARVEAGTSASARWTAEGSGVVNLVFREDAARRTGMRSLAASVASDDHYLGSAAAAGHVGDALSWDALYSLSALRPHTDARTVRWSVLPGDPPLQTDQDTDVAEQHVLHSVAAGAAATPTAHTTFALRGTYSWMAGRYRSRSAFRFADTAGNVDSSRTSSRVEHDIPSAELSAVAGFGRDRIRFTAEARTSFVDEAFQGDYHDEIGGYRYMNAVMSSRQRDHTFRNDLALRFARIAVDVGHESLFRTITAADVESHLDATVSRSLRYESAVHAGYIAARSSVGGLRAEAGLRVEAERTRVELDHASVRTATHVFPSITGEWHDVRRALAYRLAYARRIARPAAALLNPLTMSEDELNENVGNPSLRPELTDQVEFGVERSAWWGTLHLTPFLRWTRDPIRTLKQVTPGGGTITAPVNLRRAQATGADVSARVRPIDGAVVTLAGSMARLATDETASVHTTLRLTVDYQVAENTTAQFYAYRRSSRAIAQGEVLPAFTTELALTRRIARDRGRVTLRLNDPLRSDRVEVRIVDEVFTENSRRQTARPLLSLFASYAVGGAPREDSPPPAQRPCVNFQLSVCPDMVLDRGAR